MAEPTLSYQMLMKAVYASTGARNSVYPNEYNYVAMPTDTVRAILDSFNPGPWSPEVSDGVAKARRLWHMLKEQEPLSACGLVRLASPVACDLVGVVTWEDLYPDQPQSVSSGMPSGRSILEDDLLGDEISEYLECSLNLRCQTANKKANVIDSDASQAHFPSLKPVSAYTGTPSATTSAAPSSQQASSPEMTLIDPATKYVFKRSWGGTFGAQGWPVSSIRAFAVWF
ncbi:MAG: hypothetical protein A4E45_00112 [Methanosaeta sp. PtaB.Bin039]|nr:MAG: hypothetical protein A4E45_00112 [Methanosaeta sp. PtaB.Bin039]OPY47555.1 MAG: hypothetical protein A4E47_00209 [Methanosaeta sp. PtaU1.Bin028]